jgi:hypothetical protein
MGTAASFDPRAGGHYRVEVLPGDASRIAQDSRGRQPCPRPGPLPTAAGDGCLGYGSRGRFLDRRPRDIRISRCSGRPAEADAPGGTSGSTSLLACARRPHGAADQLDGDGAAPGRLSPHAARAAWTFGSFRPPPRPPLGNAPEGIAPLGKPPEGIANEPEGGANDPVGRLSPAAWRHCWIFAKSPPPGGPPAGAPEGALDAVACGAVEADGVQAEMASAAASAAVGRIRNRCRVTRGLRCWVRAGLGCSGRAGEWLLAFTAA